MDRIIATPTLALLTIMLVVWLGVEGRTIAVSASAAFSGGAQRLSGLGAFFLGSEAWTLALLGSGHGIVPEATHQVLGRVGWAFALFVAGWMMRDLGLWLGPRMPTGASRTPWRWAVTMGATVQVIGLVAVATGWFLIDPALIPGAGAAMLQSLLPPVLILGVLLLVLLHRMPGAGHFGWAPPCESGHSG